MFLGVVLFFVVVVVVCFVSYNKCVDSETEDYVKRIIEKGLSDSGSVCIQDGNSRIMLRKDFIEKEWSKVDANGKPVRGMYESAKHYMERFDEYKRKLSDKERNQCLKDKMSELTKKQQSIIDKMRRDIPKSEYEADDILKKYNGGN